MKGEEKKKEYMERLKAYAKEDRKAAGEWEVNIDAISLVGSASPIESDMDEIVSFFERIYIHQVLQNSNNEEMESADDLSLSSLEEEGFSALLSVKMIHE